MRVEERFYESLNSPQEYVWNIMYEGRGGSGGENVVSCKMILGKFLCKFLLK
jgi:hypothetical protein